MAKQFDVLSETATKAEFDFRGSQEAAFDRENCERVFEFRDIRGNVNNLPRYILEAIKAAGFKPVYLGGTTFKYSVIGLSRNK